MPVLTSPNKLLNAQSLKTKMLNNHCLIASPSMESNYFSNSVIFIARHDKDGALGLMINRPNPMILAEMFNDLEIKSPHIKNKPIMEGGPVHPEIGMVLHTGQPVWSSSLAIAENICLTSSKDILKAIADDGGVEHFLITFGFSAWAPDQLEAEIKRGDWLVCSADLALLFNTPFDERWSYASKKLGINALWLAGEIGHA